MANKQDRPCFMLVVSCVDSSSSSFTVEHDAVFDLRVLADFH